MLQFLVKTKLMLLPWPSTDRRTFTLLKSSTSDFYYHTDTSTAIGTGKKCIQWDFVLMLFSAKTKLMQIEKALNWPKNTLLKSLTLDLFYHQYCPGPGTNESLYWCTTFACWWNVV